MLLSMCERDGEKGGRVGPPLSSAKTEKKVKGFACLGPESRRISENEASARWPPSPARFDQWAVCGRGGERRQRTHSSHLPADGAPGGQAAAAGGY